MASVTYKIRDYSKEFLYKHKFRYCSFLSEYGDEVYTYRFPLNTYSKMTTIECEIAVLLTTRVQRNYIPLIIIESLGVVNF